MHAKSNLSWIIENNKKVEPFLVLKQGEYNSINRSKGSLLKQGYLLIITLKKSLSKHVNMRNKKRISDDEKQQG